MTTAPASSWASPIPHSELLGRSAPALSAGKGIFLGPQRQPDRRAGQRKILPQTVDEITTVGFGQCLRARGKQDKRRRPRLGLGDVAEPQRAAFDGGRRMRG